MKTLARIIVTAYVIMSAVPLVLIGFILMALPFVSAHYRILQISDVHVYFMGATLFSIGSLFLYGIAPDTDDNESWEEEVLALPEYAAA